KQMELDKTAATEPDYVDWRRDSKSFESIGAIQPEIFTLTGTGDPERLNGGLMTASCLEALGVRPILGRGFLAEDEKPGRNHVVLLGFGVWQRRFGSDRGVVG